jgi:pimeloyl-ACP methyl ester carboxylesterase
MDKNMASYQTPMASWPALLPYARQVEVAGRNVFYYDADPGGDKFCCVLVHGLGDEADTWRSVLPGLVSHQRVIALDLPGFGRSELPARPASAPVYVSILLELLEKLSIQQATWVGHSLGAMLVQQLALLRPEKAAGLVLVGGGLAAGKTRLNTTLLLFLIPGAGEWVYNRLRRNPQAAYQSLYPYYHNLEALPQAERDFLYARVNQRVWSDKQRRAFLSTLRSLAGWLPAQQKGLAGRLAACTTPTRIIWGVEDRIAAPENGRLLAAMLPPGDAERLILVPQAGHNVQQEKPEAVIQAVLALAEKIL